MNQYSSRMSYPGHVIFSSSAMTMSEQPMMTHGYNVSHKRTSNLDNGLPSSGIYSQVLQTPKLIGGGSVDSICQQQASSPKSLDPNPDDMSAPSMPNTPNVLSTQLQIDVSIAPLQFELSAAPSISTTPPIRLPRTYPAWTKNKNGELVPRPKHRGDKPPTWTLLTGHQIPVAKPRRSLMKKKEVKVESNKDDSITENDYYDELANFSSNSMCVPSGGSSPVQQDTPEYKKYVTQYADILSKRRSTHRSQNSPTRTTGLSNFYINSSIVSNSPGNIEEILSRDGEKFKRGGRIQKLFHWVVK